MSKGNIRARNRLVYGVGINDLPYKAQVCRYENGKQVREWICPFYKRWQKMLERAYSEKYKELYPSYEGVTVCKEWLTLSNFKSWMENQDWQDKHLDKDILHPGNKIYSPEFCVFVDHKVNSFILDCAASRGEYPIGVSHRGKSGKFYAMCSNPFTGGKDRLGSYSSADAAHEAWRKRKIEHAERLASEQEDARVSNALLNRYKT